MFRHKAKKRIVELNSEHLRLTKYALLELRNKLLVQGKPTEDVNELLLKIMNMAVTAAEKIICGCHLVK